MGVSNSITGSDFELGNASSTPTTVQTPETVTPCFSVRSDAETISPSSRKLHQAAELSSC